MRDTTVVPVILSGGSGTRLWPASRVGDPKQLMALVSDRTMLQETALRLADLDAAEPIVVCNAAQQHLVVSQLEDVGLAPHVIVEPVGRNTAPAVAAAAIVASEGGADPLLLVLPADHVIGDAAEFVQVIERAVPYGAAGKLATFGIVPTEPDTGYGYIRTGNELEPGVHEIAEFVEKPTPVAAADYVAGGEHVWNSGMFLFRASTFLSELEAARPDIAAGTRAAVDAGTGDGALVLDDEAFSAMDGDSIDYAVMEHTTAGVVVAFEGGWSDVGSWEALWKALPHDAEGNATRGDAVVLASKRSYVHSSSRLVTAYGVEDLAIIETTDAVLVVPRSRSQHVREVVEALAADNRLEATFPAVEHRPWGSFEVLAKGDGYQVKRLIVHPSAKLSLQSHRHRAEEWVVVAGTAEVTLDDDVLTVRDGETVSVAIGAKHRLANPGSDPLIVIETQIGSYLGEDDIDRYDDAYGRS